MTTTAPLSRRAREVPWLAVSIVVSAILVSVLAWSLCAALTATQARVDQLSTQRATEQSRYADLRVRVERACQSGTASGALCMSLR